MAVPKYFCKDLHNQYREGQVQLSESYAPVAKLVKAALSKGVLVSPGSSPGRGTILRRKQNGAVTVLLLVVALIVFIDKNLK